MYSNRRLGRSAAYLRCTRPGAGGADPHQVSRSVLGQRLIEKFQDSQGLGLALSDRQTADGVPREVQSGDELGRVCPQVGEYAALDDPKQGLVGTRVCLQAAFSPVVCPDDGAFDGVPVIRDWAFVKGHDDIGTQILLDGDGFLRSEAMLRSIEMRAECHAVAVDVAPIGKGENLVAA